MVAIDAVKSVSNLRAVVAELALRPVYTELSRLLTGLLPAPKVANGVKPGSPKPFDIELRNSTPPLKACLPCVQLRSSPIEYSGLTCERQAPNRPYWMKPVHNVGTGWNG